MEEEDKQEKLAKLQTQLHKSTKKGYKKRVDVVKYGKDDDRKKMLDRQVAIFVGGTNIANSVVENELFQSMLESFDARYEVPGRHVIRQQIDGIVDTMRDNIKSALSKSRKINFTTDVWSKKGLTSSYLGLTAQFFCPTENCIRCIVLAVRHLPYPHTGIEYLTFTFSLIKYLI